MQQHPQSPERKYGPELLEQAAGEINQEDRTASLTGMRHRILAVLVKLVFRFSSGIFFGLGVGVPAGCVLLVLGFAEHECLADAVALSGELDKSSVVNDAVDDRGGEFVVGEDRAPFAELDVRGEDDAPSLVAAGDDLVEQSGAVDVEGHVAEPVPG